MLILTVSTDLLPSIRFYERVSPRPRSIPMSGPTLKPLIPRSAGHSPAGGGLSASVFFLDPCQSNGGVISPELERPEGGRSPCCRGPAGGPAAGLFFAKALGTDRCITTDMGGTSFEASVAIGMAGHGQRMVRFARHKIALPIAPIFTTIGAGGGSIAWMDEGRLAARLAPQSAGSRTRPRLLRQGAARLRPRPMPISRASGYLDPDYFCRTAKMRLDLAAARRADQDADCKADGIDPWRKRPPGIYRIACNNIGAGGARSNASKRGFDPRRNSAFVGRRRGWGPCTHA